MGATLQPNWVDEVALEIVRINWIQRKREITDLGEFSRKNDSGNHLKRPRLLVAINFVGEPQCESGS